VVTAIDDSRDPPIFLSLLVTAAICSRRVIGERGEQMSSRWRTVEGVVGAAGCSPDVVRNDVRAR
jgi:hypothetical protein